MMSTMFFLHGGLLDLHGDLQGRLLDLRGARPARCSTCTVGFSTCTVGFSPMLFVLMLHLENSVDALRRCWSRPFGCPLPAPPRPEESRASTAA